MEQGRRDFLIHTAALGGGFALTLAWPEDVAAAGAAVKPAPWDQPPDAGAAEYSPWLAIGRDGMATVRVGTPELGNGVVTQNLMTVTEELHCDWAKLRAEYISVHRNYVQGQVYSQQIGPRTFFGRATGPQLMATLLQVGASARERLKEAAAQTWNVPRSEVTAKDSVLLHAASGRRLGFGDVAERAAGISLDVEPTPKPAKDWWFLGKASPPRVQQPLLVNGSAVFGIDVQVPGMVYAALLQSPVQGGRLKSHDFEKIRGMPGVIGVAVVDPDEPRPAVDPKRVPYGPWSMTAAQSAVAVVAEHYWQARQALQALPVEWDDGPGAQWQTHDQVLKAVRDAIDQPGQKVELQAGQALEMLDKQAQVVEAVYDAPFAEHATMEPLNGTALVTADRVEVWHPSQQAQQVHLIAANETGVAPENVHVHQTFVGGAFGRRIYGDDARMVVAVAKQFPGRPVKVIWSREETMRQGRYRHLTSVRLRAGLGADGLPQAFHVRAAGTPAFRTRYLVEGPLSAGLVPHVLVESRAVPFHVMGSDYRGPGTNVNSFFTEVFVDECAAAAGIDPLTYRLKLLARWPDAGWTNCLKEVAAKAQWGRQMPKGWGQGIAIANWANGGKPEVGATVAAIVTVEVSRKGALRVDSVDLAIDPGRVAYPDGVRSQLEGGAIFALNSAINERVTVANGRIAEGNFHQYPMLRMAGSPKHVHVHFGAVSGHSRMAFVGEAAMGPVPPALGNAIFAATGKRLRALPFRLHDLSWT